MGEGIIGAVARSGEPRVSADLPADTPSVGAAVIQAGFRQVAYLPLKSAESPLGVMSVATRSDKPLDERSVKFLGAVGTWAGLAIENGRLHANARRLAILEERDRIGMDLHDGIIQSVYGVGLSLENALHTVDEDPALSKVRISEAIGGLNQAIRDIRAYILDLRPRQMGNDGLMSGLRRLATEYRANTFAEIALTGPEVGLEHLPQINALVLFHVCQEALANAAKHAGAKHVGVNVWTTDERIVLEVHDDGKGFAVEKMSTTIGHGLSNMQSRAHAVGGDVDISSAPGEGTNVLAWVPQTPRH
jgi:signal transduction histidine kinase